jgi:hypothetical protein
MGLPVGPAWPGAQCPNDLLVDGLLAGGGYSSTRSFRVAIGAARAVWQVALLRGGALAARASGGPYTLIAAQPQGEVCGTEAIETAREPLIIGPP